jgi:YesN/AraC family two-component response regulator
VTEVCFESGFQNIPNFLKQFKKQTGKTPLKYQKEYVRGNTM